MPIKEHPQRGSIITCDFTHGFINPEMDKNRPVIVLSKKIAARYQLCTVVALSTTAPNPIMPYHCQIDILPTLPKPFSSKGLWIKGDMINTVGFHRLNLIKIGKNSAGKRLYYYDVLDNETLNKVSKCVFHGMGYSSLIKYL